MKKIYLILLIVFSFFIININEVNADDNNVKDNSFNNDIVEDNIENKYEEYKTDSTCDTLLGSTTSPDYPAYWLKLALDIMKYLGIIALVVLSTIDFIKAIAEQDSDALSKATKTTISRLIFAVILFIFPPILQLLFDVAGITTDVNCGISENVEENQYHEDLNNPEVDWTDGEKNIK